MYDDDDDRYATRGRMQGRDRGDMDRGYADRGRSFGSGRGMDYGPSDYGSGGDAGFGRSSGSNRDYGDRGGFREAYGRGIGTESRRGSGDRDYGSRDYGSRSSRDRDDDRGFFDRASDEVRSWFGDEDAERRRSRDEMAGTFDERDPSGRYRRNFEQGDAADRRAREGYSSGRYFYEGRTYASDRDDDRSSRRYGSGGSHRGVGPEGYSRSTDRITEDVNEQLTDHAGLDASGIRVQVEDGEVTLEGTVASRRDKRTAEDVAEGVRGVHDVHNRLRVQRDDASRGSMRSSGAGSSSTSGAGMSESGTSGSSGTSTTVATGDGGAAGAMTGTGTRGAKAGATGKDTGKTTM